MYQNILETNLAETYNWMQKYGECKRSNIISDTTCRLRFLTSLAISVKQQTSKLETLFRF